MTKGREKNLFWRLRETRLRWRIRSVLRKVPVKQFGPARGTFFLIDYRIFPLMLEGQLPTPSSLDHCCAIF